MIITDKDTAILLGADSNPFGVRLKGFDKNGDMIKGIVEIDLLTLKGRQIVFDDSGGVKLDAFGNIMYQDIEVDLITIEHPNGSDSLMSRRVVNVGSMNP